MYIYFFCYWFTALTVLELYLYDLRPDLLTR